MKKTLMTLAVFLTVGCVSHAFATVDRINVTDYGAIPNDGTDDTAAINSAFAAAGSTGGSIYFPPGAYNAIGRIIVPSNKSFRIYGDGPGVSVINWAAGVSGGGGFYAGTVGTNTLNVDGLSLIATTPMNNTLGFAIYAAFSNPNNKFHTATIHNVEIRGNTEDGTTGGYWGYGINLSRAQNAVVDKVDITGNTTLTTAGINWTSPTTIATTGLFLTNIEIKFCNSAIVTGGWVEGFYMSGFEIVDNGVSGQPSLNLISSRSTSPSPEFHLVNGHIDTLGDGVRMTNIGTVEIAHVGFHHSANGNTIADSSLLALNNCPGANIVDCTFSGTTSPAPANENGIFLTTTTDARVSGNIFGGMQPTAGSCIVAYTGSNTIRVTDNIFDDVRNDVDNHIGASLYYDTDNIVK